MHSRVDLLSVLSAVVLAAATGWIVGGCAPGETANKTLVAGYLVENTGLIDIEAFTNDDDADDAPGPTINVGDAVNWTYVVTNTGVAALSDVAVTDSQGVDVACPKTTLEVGESMTCTASGTAVEGQYENAGTVVGTDPNGQTVTDTDLSHYLGAAPVVTEAAIDIEKAVNGEDADEATGPVIAVGDPVAWTYVVTNTGTVALIDVAVTDSDAALVITCPQTTLAVGESMTCTAEGVAVEGQYSNTGTVTATDESANAVTDSDASYYLGQAAAPVEDKHYSCGLGFWKNHPDAWAATGHTADETVASVFASAAGYPGVADVTLAAALRLPGGPTLDDAAALLLKQAIPALLSAGDPDLNSTLTESEIVDLVNAALDSKDRSTILSAKSDLAQSDDGCPLGNMEDGDGPNGHMNGDMGGDMGDDMNGHHDSNDADEGEEDTAS